MCLVIEFPKNIHFAVELFSTRGFQTLDSKIPEGELNTISTT